MFNKIRSILKIKFGHISVTFYNKEQLRGGRAAYSATTQTGALERSNSCTVKDKGDFNNNCLPLKLGRGGAY